MKLRKLSSSGIAQFTDYLAQLKIEPSLEPPKFLLTEAVSSEELLTHAVVTDQVFPTRLAAAQYLDNVLRLSGLPQVERDVGLWAWLTLFYFDQVCPTRADGGRKLLEYWRYMPAIGNFQKYYRHLLLGPFQIYRTHSGDETRVAAILANQLHITDDLLEQLASRQELATNAAVLGASTILYIDKKTRTLKRGARGSTDGSPRRLADVLNQFDLTYDLYGMSAEQVVSMLPLEFNRFRI